MQDWESWDSSRFPRLHHCSRLLAISVIFCHCFCAFMQILRKFSFKNFFRDYILQRFVEISPLQGATKNAYI